MTAEIFIDTNILLYAQSKHPAESVKREQARDVLRHSGIALSSQVLGEFYVNATRKLTPAMDHESAVRILRRLEVFPILPIGQAEVFRALEIRARYAISHWDSLVVAAAEALQCHTIMSEDLNAGQAYGGVKVVNPFH
jgi:predicted nucleic acid-binding protein